MPLTTRSVLINKVKGPLALEPTRSEAVGRLKQGPYDAMVGVESFKSEHRHTGGVERRSIENKGYGWGIARYNSKLTKYHCWSVILLRD